MMVSNHLHVDVELNAEVIQKERFKTKKWKQWELFIGSLMYSLF